MPGLLDVSSDFEVFDDVQTVTLALKTQDSSTQPVAGVTKSKLAFRQIEALGEVYVESKYRNFSLPVANCGGKEPNNGDWITEADGDAWIILDVALAVFDTAFLCECQKAVGVT